MSINIDKAKLKEELDILRIHKLTLLNARSALAFTVPDLTPLTEYNFGTTVPENTILALCKLKYTQGADIIFQMPPSLVWKKGAGGVYYSTYTNFDGAVFAVIPVKDRKTVAWNGGGIGVNDVGVYVVGYVTEETSGKGFSFVGFEEDIQVITGGTAVVWTDVDASILISKGDPQAVDQTFFYDPGETADLRLIGLYVALDCATDQNVYFRKKGSSEAGVLWEPDTVNPGTHLLGFIPCDYDGVFQYYTSAGNAINVYVEGLVFEASHYLSDKIMFPFYCSSDLTGDSTWREPNGAVTNHIRHLKAIWCHANAGSGYQLNTFKLRPKGGTNAQITFTLPGCGAHAMLTPLGDDGTFESWSNTNDTVYKYLCVATIAIAGH